MKYVVTLERLTLLVRLGHVDSEREFPQAVTVNIDLETDSTPRCFETDELDDAAICYEKISQDLQKFCMSKEFLLLEHLANEMHKFLKGKLPTLKVTLRISKTPPMNSPRLDNFVVTIAD